jgi:hypothetical protein
MPNPDHAAVMNEKAHQAKALMGFTISAFWKPAPMASRGQCTPGFFKYCKACGPLVDQMLTKNPPNDVDGTAIFLNSHARPERVPEPFSRRCRPAAGCEAGGSERVPDR